MVMRGLLTAMILAASTSTVAQSVDWDRAGGDMFGRKPEAERSDPEGRVGNGPRIAELSQPYQEAIDEAARIYGLDPKLLHALVITESAYQPNALSPVGAGGLTQLMPGTAAELGVVDRFDPVENVRGGADYLARQIVRFGDVRLALAAYNAGPERVARLGRVPSIPETENYVVSVVECYLALTAGRAVTHSRQCRKGGGGV